METKPKTKRPKKRFTSREQIIARIDKFTIKAKRQRESQRDCYVKSGQARRAHEQGDDSLLRVIRMHESKGDKWGLKADRLEKDVLPALKAKLAEFDTDTIPGITTDRSVEAV